MTIQKHSDLLEIYRFILGAIRNEDQRGDKFLERFLQGPQDMWQQIETRMFQYLELWDVVNVEDENLQYLKNMVGWTPDLENITNAVSDLSLRRLIANAVNIWKRRGTADIISDLLFFATGGKNKLFDWFYYRNLLDESALGEDYYLSDSFEDDSGGDSEFTMVIKMVDDGLLDRDLAVNLCKLMRPANEKIVLLYHNFLDYFQLAGDSAQWETINSDEDESITVEDGTLKLFNFYGPILAADVPNSPAMTNHRFSCDLKMVDDTPEYYDVSPYIFFQLVDNYNHRALVISQKSAPFPKNEVVLYRYVSGIFTEETTVYLDDLGFTLPINIYHKYSVELIEESPNQRVKFYIDENEVINIVVPSIDNGTIGYGTGQSETIHIKNVENMLLPAESDTITP